MIFFVQALLYFFATLNMRFVAKSQTAGVLLTDVCLCTSNYMLVQQVTRGGNIYLCLAGGVLGSLLAMTLDKKLLKQT